MTYKELNELLIEYELKAISNFTKHKPNYAGKLNKELRKEFLNKLLPIIDLEVKV